MKNLRKYINIIYKYYNFFFEKRKKHINNIFYEIRIN